MPCVVCREVVVDVVYATVHVTDDYLRWACSHCARTSATANGDLAQPKPAQRATRRGTVHPVGRDTVRWMGGAGAFLPHGIRDGHTRTSCTCVYDRVMNSAKEVVAGGRGGGWPSLTLFTINKDFSHRCSLL